MRLAERYPLPVGLGSVLGGICAGLIGWQLWGWNNVWAVVIAVAVGVAVAVLVGTALWSNARLLCLWVVAMVPPSWRAHAEMAGLFYQGGQLGFYRERRPIPVAKIKAVPHVKNGALWVPVKTNHGSLTRHNAEDLAASMAEVMTLSSSRVEFPDKRRNPGYVWFIMSKEDKTR